MLTMTRQLAVALCIAAIPAAAQSVHTDYDHHADFRRFHTFCVDRVHSADPLYEGRMREALNYTLSHTTLKPAGGTLRTRTDQGPAPVEVQAGCDLAVRALGSVREQQEYSTFYNGFGPGWGYGGWGGPGFGYGYGGGFGGFGGYRGGPSITRVEQIPMGTLVVDLYDTRNKHLVFRGIATQQVSHRADRTREDSTSLWRRCLRSSHRSRSRNPSWRRVSRDRARAAVLVTGAAQLAAFELYSHERVAKLAGLNESPA